MESKTSILRLTAFWALCESGLGGILHATQIPFKGALLCFLALMSISLIAKISDHPFKDVVTSTIVVILIKAAISPHSPITAYLAVAFQGFTGALFLSGNPSRIVYFIWAPLCFLETAVQKLLTLWLFFGTSFWEAVDGFGAWVLNILNWSGAGWTLPIGLYISIYSIVAFITAWRLPFLQASIFEKKNRLPKIDAARESSGRKKSRWRKWTTAILIGILILGYILQAQGWNSALWVFLRSMLIIFLWFTIVGPFLSRWFIRLLKRRSNEDTAERMEQTLAFFPVLKDIVYTSWKEVKDLPLFPRLQRFLILSLASIIWYEED